MSCSDNKNPLQPGGTSQLQRNLPGLQPGYVQVEERDVADWVVFASAFAKYLNYFDKTNKTIGDWQPFFNSDISAILASAAVQNISLYQQTIKEQFALLKTDAFAGDDNKLKETLASLFAALLSLTKAIDEYFKRLPDSAEYKPILHRLVISKFQPALQRLLAYYKGAVAENLLIEADIPDWKVFNMEVVKASSIVAAGLSSVWIKGNTDWLTYYNSIGTDTGIYTGTNVYQKINHAANHNLFTSVFDQFLMSYARLIKDSEDMLMRTLSLYSQHPPHYALFLAFLRLFRYAKEHINSITHRHLDFYYKEVLRLLPKQAEANHVHVIIELAKHVNEYLLPKGSLFKAGKDSGGKEVLYSLDNDVVFTTAKVAALKAVYKAGPNDNTPSNGVTINNNNRIFAAPIINSADGLGKEIKTINKEWHPFVNKSYADGQLVSIDMPKAAVGFAIASPYLFLNEGQRIINVKLVAASGSASFPASMQLECYLTHEKGWYRTADPVTSSSVTTEGSTAKLISITLPGDAPAITNYGPKVHGGNFTTTYPVLKLVIKNDDNASYTYGSLVDILITKIEIEVRVGVDNNDSLNNLGVKNLLLSNDNGALDPAKPFNPFGISPKAGASFIIGNEEVFKKKNALVKLKAEWADLPSNYIDIDYEAGSTEVGDKYPKAKVRYLANGIWKTIDTGINIFNNAYADVSFPANFQLLNYNNNEAFAPYDEVYTPYNIKSKRGFLKLTLNNSFNYEAFDKDTIQYNIDKAWGRTATDPGVPPYVPKMAAISLHYKAATIVDLASSNKSKFDNREIQFYHLHPFGEAEQHKLLNDSTTQALLPQLSYTNNETAGEFYIGIENLGADESVNILFQVLEGSTDPLLDKPEEHVRWSYLANNLWINFKKEDINDQTKQLIQSGIVTFVLPSDVTSINTLLPPGFVWLRATVNVMAQAVCKLLSVQAQAAVVTFVNNNNAPGFSDSALPAMVISKLKQPVSSIKKIAQPYSSFGGRKAETSPEFYTRVSERLRHKSRAISIWDYEHLVLQQFPSIHKVKCLNHTRFIGNDYNEVAPGHVTIVTVPNLENRNDVNPLRPFTNEDVLAEIEAYLKKKISCHVQLNVRHPLFEEIMMAFDLKLVEGLPFKFYHDLLQQEITEFLTPWAFGKAKDVAFGGLIHKSTMINFIEERSYVEYITNVKMYHITDPESPVVLKDVETVIASTARSILVSVTASKHIIAEIVEVPVSIAEEDCVDEWNTQKS
jgi:hypothetical protein